MTRANVERGPATREPRFRYGAVLLLTLALLIVMIVTPAGAWSRATVLAIEGAVLIVIVATGRERPDVRRARALGAGVCAVAVVVLVGTDVLSAGPALVLNAAVLVVIPFALTGGLVRLVRSRGVTVEAVMGALTMYLLVGLVFVVVMGVVVHADRAPFFAQGTDGTQGDRVYYSFTVLTTTGFGDLTAARPLGRALAVFEMLLGQLYLVTVIGLLIGNFVGRARSRD